MLAMILTNFSIMVLIFVGVWLISVKIKDASIVDILWGPACAFPAVLTYFLEETTSPRDLVITVLAVLWSSRLALYLAKRNLGHGEDFRYVKMREKAGSDKAFAIKSLRTVFLFQCCLAFFVSLPVQVGQIGGAETLGPLAYLGIAGFCIGLFFEAVGDYQLTQFKKNPENKGKLMDRGLWAWTRHPNYFGDAAVWTGFTLIAFESTYGFFTILSPALMIYCLYHFTGKGLLERLMRKRYPDYEAYEKKVSGFFPLPPGWKR